MAMVIRGFIVLVFLGLLMAPTSAARQGQHDDELNLESQIDTQDEDQSSAAGQQGTQMQNSSQARGPTLKQIKMASAAAGFAKTVYSGFALSGMFASFSGAGGTIVSRGVKIWAKEMEIRRLRDARCAEFLQKDFGREMLRVWEGVIVPALTDEAVGCHDCDSKEKEACEKGRMKNDNCLMIERIAEHWLLYMETFLAVLAYISAHPDQCTSHLDSIQSSWNDLADGVDLATSTFHWKYEFSWRDFKDHPTAAQRETTMSGMKRQLELGTAWNPFRSRSSLERIIVVAKILDIYDPEGRIAAPECLE